MNAGMPPVRAEKERIVWIDVFKGIMIILVVFGHSGSPLTGLIYAFHMPAFLFISGFSTRFETSDVGRFVARRAASLMLPFFFINGGFLALRKLMQIGGVESLFYAEPLNLSSAVLGLAGWLAAPDLGGASWFLPVLLFSSVLVCLIVYFWKANQLPTGFAASFILLTGAAGYFMSQRGMLQRMMVDLSVMAVLFVGLGYLASKTSVLEHINHRYMVPIAVIFVWFSVRAGYSFMNWPTRDFKHILWIVPTSFSGIYLTAMASRIIARNRLAARIFSYLGQRTLSILMFHFLAFRLFFMLLYRMRLTDVSSLRWLVPPSGNGYWVWISLFAIVVSIGISLVADRIKWLSLCINGKNKWIGAGNP